MWVRAAAASLSCCGFVQRGPCVAALVTIIAYARQFPSPCTGMRDRCCGARRSASVSSAVICDLICWSRSSAPLMAGSWGWLWCRCASSSWDSCFQFVFVSSNILMSAVVELPDSLQPRRSWIPAWSRVRLLCCLKIRGGIVAFPITCARGPSPFVFVSSRMMAARSGLGMFPLVFRLRRWVWLTMMAFPLRDVMYHSRFLGGDVVG